MAPVVYSVWESTCSLRRAWMSIFRFWSHGHGHDCKKEMTWKFTIHGKTVSVQQGALYVAPWMLLEGARWFLVSVTWLTTMVSTLCWVRSQRCNWNCMTKWQHGFIVQDVLGQVHSPHPSVYEATSTLQDGMSVWMSWLTYSWLPISLSTGIGSQKRNNHITPLVYMS